MSLVSAVDIEKSFAEDTLFENVSFNIDEGQRVGLIGANGTGKTTLFRILAGEEDITGGTLIKSNSLNIGYMEQTVKSNERCAYDYVLSVFSPLIAAEGELEELRIEMERTGDERIIARHSALHDKYLADGGMTFRARTKSMLSGLGFSEDEVYMPLENLSGGQMTRLSLARILLSEANLLLLDEPTNHLDLKSTDFLENFLQSSKKAYIIISHDRYFLDKVTTRTMELDSRRLIVYDGSYSTFIKKKEEAYESAMRKYNNTVKEIRRIEGIIEQQRRFGRERNFITAASKQKAVDRLRETLERPETDTDAIRFSFPCKKTVANDILRLSGLTKNFDSKKLFSDFDFELHKGERVFVTGDNGCGKSTMFKIIMGALSPDRGSAEFGSGVEAALYDQTQSDLHADKTVIDEIWDRYPRMTETEVRNRLAAFLFRGDDVFREVGLLSGGEKARLALLCLMMCGSNLLLLDEPTNHLDISSREALEGAIMNYEGTVMAISHDRYLINKLADRTIVFEDGKIIVHDGNYDDYLARRTVVETVDEQKEKPVSDYKMRKEAESAKRKKESAIRRAETAIEQAENEKAALEAQLESASGDYELLMELGEKIAALDEKIAALMDEWEKLSE